MKSNNKVILKSFLDNDVDEKYYLTNETYEIKENKRIFKNKVRDDIEYEVDMDKVKKGGICGFDKHTKFAISSRLFSIYGNSPTLTANNTADNSKIVIINEDE